MWLKLLLFVVISVVASEKVRYDNYVLYKVHPKRDDQVNFLKDLQEKDGKLDFWKPASKVGKYVSVVSPPEKREEFERMLRKKNIVAEVMQDNIQEAFDQQIHSRKKRFTSEEMNWTNYQTYDEILDWFQYLAREHSDIVTIVTSWYTYEGRNVTGIKIARGKPEKVFFLNGGEVAADWLSPVVLTYFINELVKGIDPEAKQATEDFEWHIFPVTNPDGFEYSQNAVRLWMKNRRPTILTQANGIGTDLSKNWNSQWGVSGGSHTPSANNFIGVGPFSEDETRMLSRYIESIGSRLTGVFSVRSFGQRLVLPFAHSTWHYSNYDDMLIVGRRAMGSLAVRYGTQYLVGLSKEVLDGATGSMVDWVKHNYNPVIAATYYLRDTGAWGYTLPINQILPTCEETFDSLLAILREARYMKMI